MGSALCGLQVLDRAVFSFAKAVLAEPALVSQYEAQYDLTDVTPENLKSYFLSDLDVQLQMDADTASRVLSSVPNLEIEVGGGTLTVRGETLFAQTTGETTALP